MERHEVGAFRSWATRRYWRIVAVAYASWTIVGMGLRLLAGAFEGNLLGLAGAFVTWTALVLGVGMLAVSAVVDFGAAGRRWVGVVVAVFLLLGISQHWIDMVGDLLFADIQRTKIPYYERLVNENRPHSGDDEDVLVDEPSVNVIIYDPRLGYVEVLLLDARRRSIVHFDHEAQPRSPRFDHQHLRRLEGSWYWAEPFK